jgi:hypothetical protein
MMPDETLTRSSTNRSQASSYMPDRIQAPSPANPDPHNQPDDRLFAPLVRGCVAGGREGENIEPRLCETADLR